MTRTALRHLLALGTTAFGVACGGTAPTLSDTPVATEGSSGDDAGGTVDGDRSSGDASGSGAATTAAGTTGAPGLPTETTSADTAGTSEAPQGCVAGAVFGPVTLYSPFADLDLSEPWVSPDGDVLLATLHTGEFELGLGRSTRDSASDPFGEPALVSVEGWADDVYQGGLEAETGDLVFVYGGEVFRAPATDAATAFAAPVPAGIAYPELSEWPEFPRPATGGLYFSQRELNHRRSIYSYAADAPASLALLYDAGDIFSFAVTPDGSTLYVTFQDESYDLKTFRGSRRDTSSTFGNLELLDQFDLDDGFAATGVTGDDCEVFGFVHDNAGNARIWHAIRGG